jgi:hypothetical protein
VTDVTNVSFYTPFGNSLDAGTTNYLVSISQSAANQLDGIIIARCKLPERNCVNDTINSKTYSGNNVMPYYSFTRSTPTVPTVLSGPVMLGASTFASLGSPSNGNFFFCFGCTIANPCASGGTGALAKRLNGAWVCN